MSLLMVLMGCILVPAACVSDKTETPYAFDYERLWTFDPGQPGLARNGASQQITWKKGGVNLSWIKTPQEFVVDGSLNFEKREKRGVTYYFDEKEVAGDGRDADGKWFSIMNFTRTILFEQDGYGYRLSADASRKRASLRKVSIGTALDLAEHPGMVVRGFDKSMDGWHTTFRNGDINLSITINPPPYDQQIFDQYLAQSGLGPMTAEDGLQYISSRRDRSAEYHMNVDLFVRTEIGMVSVQGWTHSPMHYNVPADSFDFITLDLARAVTAWIRDG
ncbi:MAG: hypothetical protein KBA30_00360 [Clostridia bacterium]|nr:hypothetical protein [Clostridia bacterium]